MILYGIKNCDTVKKARSFLDARGIAYQFHDFRSDGLDKNLLQHFLAHGSHDALINKRSTTWKQLSSDEQNAVNNGDITAVCLANPTLLKRPILAINGIIAVGFSEQQYLALLQR